jgi:NodT family efflux transporter outer membrane factor (OMF) lipoprotein
MSLIQLPNQNHNYPRIDMTPHLKYGLIYLMTILGLSLIVGCAAGPNYEKPAAPADSIRFTAEPLSVTDSIANIVGGGSQQFVKGLDISGEWWTLFHSKPLNDLIERSLKRNPDIKAGQAALIVARENVLAQRGAYYPAVSASVSAMRQRTSQDLSASPNTGDLTFSLFTPQVGVAYTPDVFGLNRRTVESLEAQAEQARFALAATHITLSATVVAAAIQEASIRAQIDATRELVTINTDMVQILRTQLEKGYASRLDLAAQESQLAQIKATLPPLLKQLAQQRDLLSALSGGFPNQDLVEKFELSSLQLPQELPMSLPSKLVEQRPDVRQAEENLHSASAQIGVAVANRLPNFMLSANVGSSALDLTRIFSPGVFIWDLALNITQPIYDGGTLSHRELAARAAYTQAVEQYRGTVLTAFQSVADALNALEQDASALKAAVAASDAAGITLDLAKKQWQSGYASYITLLNAQQTYQQAIISLVQAQANRYADTAALFFALGGGWWNRDDLPKK